MRHLLVSSLLLTGLTLGGVSAVHAEGTYKNNAPEQEMTQPKSSSDFSGESSQYTVQEGDTLASIAEEHLGSQDQWQVIARVNGIANPDQLEVGQTLTIPASGERSDAAPESSMQNPGQNPGDIAFNEGDAAQPDSDPARSDSLYDETVRGDSHSDATQNDPALGEEQEIRGEITEIASGSDSLTLKDESGMTHNFKLEDQAMIDGVSVGDFVKVELEGGTVVSLEKVDRSA